MVKMKNNSKKMSKKLKNNKMPRNEKNQKKISKWQKVLEMIFFFKYCKNDKRHKISKTSR
jgi:hypothetical protein